MLITTLINVDFTGWQKTAAISTGGLLKLCLVDQMSWEVLFYMFFWIVCCFFPYLLFYPSGHCLFQLVGRDPKMGCKSYLLWLKMGKKIINEYGEMWYYSCTTFIFDFELYCISKELHANSTTHNQTCYCNILITNNIEFLLNEQCNMLQSINSQPYYKPDSSAQW